MMRPAPKETTKQGGEGFTPPASADVVTLFRDLEGNRLSIKALKDLVTMELTPRWSENVVHMRPAQVRTIIDGLERALQLITDERAREEVETRTLTARLVACVEGYESVEAVCGAIARAMRSGDIP